LFISAPIAALAAILLDRIPDELEALDDVVDGVVDHIPNEKEDFTDSRKECHDCILSASKAALIFFAIAISCHLIY